MKRGCFFILILFSSAAVRAHEITPAYLELTETQPYRFAVLWKVPKRGESSLDLRVEWPSSCKDAAPVTRETEGNFRIEHRLLECRGGLIGRRITIGGSAAPIMDVLVRIEFLDHRNQINLLKADSLSFTVSGRRPRLQLAREYLTLGMEHILFGVDHLLFVLGLLLIVRSRWMLVKTVTAFTIAHSITLAIATFGYASAPAAPLNAAIALSILFLGPEIARVWRGGTSLTIRHPWIVAFAFGLLHGFGFSSALADLGLRDRDLALALFTFNVGVEIGQVSFVVLIVLLERSFRQLEIRWPRWVELMPGYAVGSLGAYWTIERTIMMMGFLQ